MRRRIIAVVLMLRTTLTGLFAFDMDSLPNWPCMAVPVINYTPETRWEFGAAAQAYFHVGSTKTSIVQAGGAYSLNRQWYANVQGTLYMGEQLPWLIQFRAGYRNYPDTYYGVGAASNKAGTYARIGTHYDSQRAYAFVQPLVHVGSDWYIGPHVEYLWERTRLQGADETVETQMPGIGVTLQYDTRDIVYYPNSGLFFKFSASHYNRWWHATTGLTACRIDLRHYVPLGKSFVWCYQLRADIAASSTPKDIPFQLLPSVGGQDLVRGVPYGMFRDNTMIALQTELRMPIWRWIRACVFAGIGDVYDYTHWQWSRPKVGYGLGLRLAINRAKINIRADVARNNIYPSWGDIKGYGFYLTATEAF